MKNCLDTGTIQAFLDGELKPAAAASVSTHIAACDACSAQLATAEEESSFVFSVLEREMDALVPTQRLWTKINDTIAVEKETAPLWKKAWAYLAASLASPSIAIAAAVLVVLGLVSVVTIERGSFNSDGEIARVPSQVQPAPVVISVPSSNPGPDQEVGAFSKTEAPKSTYVPASYHPEPRSPIVRPKGRNGAPSAYMPGEESYMKTIASLNQTVNGQKDTALQPSERISYERDMAVVDDAIAKLRNEVRKNPKNDSAKQVLYNSYQNKIDLLNSVSQREELVASLK